MACWPAWKHGTIAALLTGLVVFLDVTWPSLSIYYFLPTLYVAWAMRGRVEWILYGALTVTVLLTTFLGAPNRVSAKGTLNRALGVSVGLFMAYLIRERRRNADRLQCLSEQLEARVEERSAELNATVDRLRQSEQELRQHLAELTVLNRMGVICSEVSTDDELLHRATTLITETLFPDNCGFLLLDADRGVLVTHPSFVLSDPTVSRADKALGTGITGQVALTGHARRVGDVSQEPGYLAADSSTRSELCIPMQIGSKVVGVLNIESRKPNAFSDIDEQLASTIVDLVSNSLERLRAETATRLSEQHFALFMQHLPGLAWIKDDQGRYIFANAAAEQAFGISLSLLFGKTDDEIFPLETAAQFKVADQQALASGTEVRTVEALEHDDGVLHHAIVSKFSLPSFDGQALLVGGMAIDITEHKQAEDQLRQSEARYRQLVENSPYCIHELDAEGRFLSMNAAGLRMMGQDDPDCIRGSHYLDAVSAADRPLIAQRLDSAKAGTPSFFEFTAINGRYFSSNFVPLSGGTTMGITQDITERKRVEETLEMMRFSVDHAGDSVFWVSPTGHILYVNDAACAGRGYSRDELLSMTVFDLDPDFQPVVWEPHFEDLRNHGTLTFETRHRAKDGRVFPIEVNANYVHIGDQEFNFAFVRDITERKRAEAALRESERRLNFALEMSQIGAWEVNLQDHTAYRTQQHGRIFGYETLQPNWSLERFLEHVLPEDRPDVERTFREAIAKQTNWNFEFRIRRADGEVRWLWAAGGHEQPLVGNPTRISGVVRDITKRKLAQDELRRSQKQFQQLFQSSPLATLLYSASDGRIADANLRFLEMFQFRLEEVIGRTGPELGLWCDLAARDQMVDQLQRGQEVRNFEVRLRSKEGHEYDMLLSSLVIELPAGSMVIVQANDITERKQTQVALTLFRTLLDHCNDGFEIINPDTGRFLDVNDQACWSHGYTREEYLALTVPQIDPLVGERPWEETRQELYRSGFAILDTLHRRKDGSVFPVEVNVSLIRLDRDYFLAVVRDITERKRAAEALRQSEEQHRVILETLPVGVLIHDGQQMYYANPKAAQILGVQHPDELSRIDPMGIVAPEYRELARGRVEATLRTGHSLPSIEAVVLRVDGSRVNVEVNSRPTHFAGQDCMQVLFHDITDRKHAEETIQRILDGIAPTTGQEFFSTLVKYLCDVCGVEIAMAGAVDPDHPYEVQTIACSRRGQPIENFRYDTHGTPCEHVIGKTLCFHPTNVQEEFPEDCMLVEMGIDSYMGIPLWTSHGDPLGLIALLNDRAFPDPVQTQVILQVVAARCGAELERQRAENRFRKNEERMLADLSLRQRDLLHASRLNAIGQMVAGLSHEVAQPLNAISNFAVASTRLLDSDTSGTPDALREYVQAIVVQSQRCAAILRRLRDFSRRTPTVKTACDLNSLLTESVELIASETRRKHAGVQLDLATELPQVSADRVQIQQVVFNLLNNALEAVQDQEIDHRLLTVRSRAETDSITFEVEDHGSGITPEIVQQLFEPFFTTKRDGMGIGLNICETIVRDHGGRIEVESNEYGGATFRVHLPFPREDGSISKQILGVVQ